jgi:hypothetical protein
LASRSFGSGSCGCEFLVASYLFAGYLVVKSFGCKVNCGRGLLSRALCGHRSFLRCSFGRKSLGRRSFGHDTFGRQVIRSPSRLVVDCLVAGRLVMSRLVEGVW